MKAKIEHVEPQLAQKLENPFKNVLTELHYSIPTNYELRVSLVDAKGKKKRRNEAAVN